jgi:hypothetical protein
LAYRLLASSKKGMSSHQLHRTLGVTYKTAWFVAHRIREAMRPTDGGPLGGEGKTVEADETYVGGKARNRQKHRDKPGRGRGTSSPMIFAAIERSGEACAAVVPSASAVALDPLMFRWFDRTSILSTDELAVYDWFGSKMRRHYRVNHSAKEFARTEDGIRVHVNTAEGYFGLFKRAIFGIHHHVSPKHLHRYVHEHNFRYNGREHETGARIARCLIGSHGRLRLRELFA